VHSEEEFGHINDDIDIIGVNNRDLKTMETDINTSLKLIEKIPKEKTAISESGIQDPATLIKLRNAGFKGFLIGEKFMGEADPGKAFKQFVSELKTL
jgi:indole-3-glycerol phosphate synthase